MLNECWRRARHSGMRCGRAVLAIVLLLVLGPMLVHAADESASPPRSSSFVHETLLQAGAVTTLWQRQRLQRQWPRRWKRPDVRPPQRRPRKPIGVQPKP